MTHRAVPRTQPSPRSRRPAFEGLEDRTLLAAAVLNIDNTTGSATKGLLTYAGSANFANNLTVKTATQILDPSLGYTQLNYTFTEKSGTITLGAGAIQDGWTGSGTATVTGPGSIKQLTTTTYVSSVAINLQNGNDSVAIASVGASTSLAFANVAGNVDNVTIGGAGGAQGITGNLTITNSAGSTALTVNDSGDTTARTVFLSGGQIANLEPSLILFGGANVSSLSIIGANALGTLNVNADGQGPVSVAGGASTGSGTISIGADAPISFANFLAVNVSNAADQPLTQVSQEVVTSTGDSPTEGKSFTYLTSSFADADPQAKASGFVASIDWGDGSAPVSGSISADGSGHFLVSGTHTYTEAGSYPVVTTITDLGTTDSLSVAGIAVTISDLGGGGLTTGSVAQVNLVSNTSAIPAATVDPKLVNPWGIADDASGNPWVADENSGFATFEGTGGSTPPGTAVKVPSASGSGTGSPAAIVFNPTTGFAIGGVTSAFLYGTLDGTISGWSGSLASPTAAIAVNNSASGAIYTGLAIAANAGQMDLYAANFHARQIEVYNSTFAPAGTFTDPNTPAGYAPYNVENIGGNLDVTYALQDPTGKFAVAGLGDGFVDVFSPSGTLIQRLATAAPLDAPYGIALAPSTFGQFAGDLLIAEQGNGQVDAFNPATGQFLGALPDASGSPIANAGLHGLAFGPTGQLVFTSGPAGGTEGLLGALTAAPTSVVIAPATLTATVSNITAFVGQPFNGVVATFTDANIYALPTDFTATVQWGDGSSDTSNGPNLTISQTDGAGSSFVVKGSHAYDSPTTGSPPEIVKVTIVDNVAGSTVSAQGTASISSPTLHASFSGFTAYVGVPYGGPVATFTDDAPDSNLGDYSATIHWGDGTSTSGAIIQANSAGQGYIVTDAGSHRYKAATTGGNPDVVTVSISKSEPISGGGTLTESTTTLGNVAASLPTLHVSIGAIPAVAGTVYTGQVATFTDDDPDPALENNPNGNPNTVYAATITWGDGTTSAGTIVESTTAAAAFSVIGSHAYTTATVGMAPEVVDVSVVRPSNGEASQAIGNVAVADALLAPFVQGVLFAATEGATFSGVVARFVSANPFASADDFNGSFAPVINWGDGKSSVGVVTLDGGVFDVSGSHIYTAPTAVGLADTLSVAVSDVGGSKTTITNNVVVAPSPIAFTNLALPTNPASPIIAGKAFTGDVVVFTSTNPAAVVGQFSATINWGDASTTNDPGTIRLDGDGIFHVSGTHTYAAAGTFTITVTVTIIGGATFTNDPSSATVIDAPITYTPPGAAVTKDVTGATLISGAAFTIGLGSVNDTDPNSTPGDFTPTLSPGGVLTRGISINWGDGSPVDFGGTLRPNASPGQTYTATGTHTYAAAGNYLVTVTIADVDGSTSRNTLGITVVAPPAAAAAKPGVKAGNAIAQGVGSFITAGESFDGVLAVFTATTKTAVAADFSATIDWGDEDVAMVDPDEAPGTIVQGANDPATGLATFFVSGSHIYDRSGAYDFSVDVSPTGAAATTFQSSATVSAAPLLATSAPISGTQGEPLPDETIVATFTDTAPVPDPASYIAGTDAVINWGDGTGPDVGTVVDQGSSPTGTVFVVYGEHTYENITDVFQAYQATVSIATADGGAAVVADFVDMTVPVLTDPPIAVHAVAGSSFTVPVATIHTTVQGATPGDFHATIEWGDGKTSGGTLQSQGGGTFEVIASHTYAQAGSFPVVISLADDRGNTVSDQSTATVTAAPVLAQVLSFAPAPRKAFEGPVALFTDADPSLLAAAFSATIEWGDGKTSTGTVSADGASSAGDVFLVTAAHKYASKGKFPVAITILEGGTSEATASGTITVGHPAPAPRVPKTVARSTKKSAVRPAAIVGKAAVPKVTATKHPLGPLAHGKR